MDDKLKAIMKQHLYIAIKFFQTKRSLMSLFFFQTFMKGLIRIVTHQSNQPFSLFKRLPGVTDG